MKLICFSTGLILKFILSYWKGFNCTLQLMLLPSLLPVTISGAPSPIARPPTPSILFSISLWAFTVYTGTSGISKFLWATGSVWTCFQFSQTELKQLWIQWFIGLWFLSQEGATSVAKIPYIEISVKIPSCYVSLLERGGPKCPTLYGFRFLYLKHMRGKCLFSSMNVTMHQAVK